MRAARAVEDLLVRTERARVVNFAALSRLPAIYGLREFVDASGLTAYGTDRRDLFRRTAGYVDRILKGARPPSHQPENRAHAGPDDPGAPGARRLRRRVRLVVLSAMAFAVMRVAPALALILVAAAQGPPRPDRTGDVLLGAWLAMLSAAFGALGFAIPTAASPAWRRLGVRRALIIAGALGLLSPVAGLAVGALSAAVILPLFRSAPWLAIALFHGLPGVALGLVAGLVAWAWQNRAERNA